MSTSANQFSALIFREFVLEPGLREEAKIPGKISELFSSQVAQYLSDATGMPIPPDMTREVDSFTGQWSSRLSRYAARGVADILAELFSGPEAKYRSGCRSALCHAVLHDYKAAMDALHHCKNGFTKVARHHHIYGLIHGACGRRHDAGHELRTAHEFERSEDTKHRISEALALL